MFVAVAPVVIAVVAAVAAVVVVDFACSLSINICNYLYPGSDKVKKKERNLRHKGENV